MQSSVSGNACIVHQYIGRAKVRLDALYTAGALVEIGNVELVYGDSGFAVKYLSRLVVAGIGGGNTVTHFTQRCRDGSTNTPRPAGNYCCV